MKTLFLYYFIKKWFHTILYHFNISIELYLIYMVSDYLVDTQIDIFTDIIFKFITLKLFIILIAKLTLWPQ